MAKVILVDLVHPNCSQYSLCLDARISRLCTFVGTGAGEPVYVLLGQRAASAAESPSATEAPLLENLRRLNRHVHVLTGSSEAAAVYSFKRAVDQLDATVIDVVSSGPRQAGLRVYQERLFTARYNFQYSRGFESAPCPSGEPPLTCTQLAAIGEQIDTFLQHLPAVKGDITILKSSMISDCFSHGFTTRKGGISYINTLTSLNLFSSCRRRDSPAEVSENLRRLGLRAGFLPHQLHLPKVNHASDVWVMSKAAPDSYDGIVTNQTGVVIAAPGADCMPLLFTDPVRKVIGVAHAGWKGTLLGIAMATVKAMVLHFGSELTNVVAVIGPSVGPCCFTLDQDSARQFLAIHPACVRDVESPRPRVDIRLTTRVLLERGGVLPQHIHDDSVTNRPSVTLCTACHPDTFYSHVRDGLDFGTQIGFLQIRESSECSY
ncbi:purine nucleoside phosphorylase LACC1 [Electrophorus electricus]|uniref:Purine nucleoside phosphorylase LACC1 n=1 Tax=Electrophorus electricus TaxID=8005 RepID=A0A4W4EHC2_ELEEL|nr:purine nucleoside phosphorylase LACC1 [Electrophorus electricus]